MPLLEVDRPWRSWVSLLVNGLTFVQKQSFASIACGRGREGGAGPWDRAGETNVLWQAGGPERFRVSLELLRNLHEHSVLSTKAACKLEALMPILSKGELTVDYTDTGTGPAVVLVHSSVSGNKQWRRLVEALSPTYRCLAPNLRGYGLTSQWKAGRKQTLADAAEVTLALCETIRGPIRVVGHSWGGAVSLATANRLGSRVSHLVLYEPMLTGLLHGHNRAEAWSEASGIYSAVRELGDAGNWEALAEIFTDYFNGEGTWASTPPERQRVITSQIPPNRYEWDAGSQSTTAQSFGGVTARTLILRGVLTRLVTRETVNVLCRTFPHWQLHEFHNAGHMGPLTHGAIVNAKIQSFLAT